VTGRRTAAAALAVPLLALVPLTGCGSESPAVVTGPAGPGAAQTSQAGANARVGAFVEVIGARISSRRPTRGRQRCP
jgi:hypothetical protein